MYLPLRFHRRAGCTQSTSQRPSQERRVSRSQSCYWTPWLTPTLEPSTTIRSSTQTWWVHRHCLHWSLELNRRKVGKNSTWCRISKPWDHRSWWTGLGKNFQSISGIHRNFNILHFVIVGWDGHQAEVILEYVYVCVSLGERSTQLKQEECLCVKMCLLSLCLSLILELLWLSSLLLMYVQTDHTVINGSGQSPEKKAKWLWLHAYW